MVVASGTALFAAAVLTGCGSDPEPDHQGVCVDQTTQKRVEDDQCDDDGGTTRSGGGGGAIAGLYAWRLFSNGTRFPPVGGNLANYPGSVSTLPSGHSGTYGGADRAGGTVSKASAKAAVSRGGFGKTSRSSGSVGG